MQHIINIPYAYIANLNREIRKRNSSMNYALEININNYGSETCANTYAT